MRTIIALLFVAFGLVGQELQIIKPELGQFKKDYFFEGKGQEFKFTIDARGFKPMDTIVVIKDMDYPTQYIMDTLYVSNLKNDTMQYLFVIPQSDFFMVTFINFRTVTYVHALMNPTQVTGLRDQEIVPKEGNVYYDLQGRRVYMPTGFVIDEKGNKFYFK